jgi:hypothetical protein
VLQDLEAFKMGEIARRNASPALCQWLDKLPNEFGRFALVCHFIEWHSEDLLGGPPPEIVEAGTARRAFRYLTELAYSHAQKFYGGVAGGSVVDDHAAWIAGNILVYGREEIEERDIYRSYPALRPVEKRGDIAAAMNALELQGWVLPSGRQNRFGRYTKWHVNPAVHDGRFAAVCEAERARRAGVQEKIKQGKQPEGEVGSTVSGDKR